MALDPKRPLMGVLIYDEDVTQKDFYLKSPVVKLTPIYFCSTSREAHSLLNDKSKFLAGVFVVYSKERTFRGMNVVRSAREARPVTPLGFIFQPDGLSTFSASDVKRMGVRHLVTKPIEVMDLVELVMPVPFDPNRVLEKLKDRTGSTQIMEDDGSFSAIRADDFVSGSLSMFDVFKKLENGSFERIVVAGEEMAPGTLQAVRDAGIKDLHIRRDTQQDYLSYVDFLASSILDRKTASPTIKIQQTLNHGHEVMNFLKHQGINEATVKYASKFVANVRELVSQVRGSPDSPIAKFLGDMSAYEHGVGTAMLAGALSDVLEIRMEKPVQTVGIASLLHDVGLAGLPDEFRAEDPSKLTPEGRKQFETHPERGVDILKCIPGMESAAIQAVEQHHMRLFGKGFPERPSSVRVSKIAEIVGICEEFNRLIMASSKDPAINVNQVFENTIAPGFSRQIVYAFRTAFFPKAARKAV